MKKYFKKIIKVITHRLFILSFGILAAFSILISNLFHLQIVEGEAYQQELKASILRELSIPAPRGNIYDRYGKPLALNKVAFNVKIDDSIEVEDQDRMLLNLLNLLEENGDSYVDEFPISMDSSNGFIFTREERSITRFKEDIFGVSRGSLTKQQTEMTAKETFEYLRGKKGFNIADIYSDEEARKIMVLRYPLFLKRYTRYQPITVAVDVSDRTVAILEERHEKYPGVYTDVQPLRYYPEGDLFSHILGYIGNIREDQYENLKSHGYTQFDTVGQTGIEEKMEILLNGKDGKRLVEVDKWGRRMNVLDTEDPVPGMNIYLTIDEKLQNQVSDILEQKLTDILLSRIERHDTSSEPSYSLDDIFTALVNNNIISLRNMQDASEDQVQWAIDQKWKSQLDPLTRKIALDYDTQVLENRLLNEKMLVKHMIELGRITMSQLIQLMKDDEIIHISDSDRQRYIHTLSEFLMVKEAISKQPVTEEEIEKMLDDYDIYYYALIITDKIEKGEIALQGFNGDLRLRSVASWRRDQLAIDLKNAFLNMIDNNLITIEQMEASSNLKQKIDAYQNDSKSNFRKAVFNHMIQTNQISDKDMIKLLVEQGIISGDEQFLPDLDRGKIKPVTVIKNKIAEREITPQDLNLDPCTGSVVVVDVHTGEVLAMVSYPSYDNNQLVNDFNNAYWTKILNDPTKPLYPRATKELYAPGSTFKMVTALAALEEGVVTPNEIIRTKGIFEDVIPPVKCWIYRPPLSYGNHGPTNLRRALEVSCNYYFSEIATRLAKTDKSNQIIDLRGINTLQKYASKFGLDQKSGIEIEEYTPSISTKDVARSAIGQGTNNFAPVHIARYLATLANGGTLYDLHLIDKIETATGSIYDKKEPVISKESTFKPDNLKAVYEGMLAVTSGSSGTSRRVFQDFPMKVAGKTGTAQFVENKDEYAWFAGFAPYDDPQIAISVMIPFGYSSTYPAEIFRDIVKSYYEIGERRDPASMDNILQ